MMESESQAKPAARWKLRWTILAAWGGLILVLAVLGWGLVRQQAGRPTGQAPDFTLHLFEGYEFEDRTEVTLSELRGRVVVINFWAEWCVECKREADLLEATWRTWRDQGVVFLGVDWVDVEPEARKYLLQYNITYPNGPDLGSRIGHDYGITGVPETFFIDKGGQVVRTMTKLGPLSQAELTGRLDDLLAGG